MIISIIKPQPSLAKVNLVDKLKYFCKLYIWLDLYHVKKLFCVLYSESMVTVWPCKHSQTRFTLQVNRSTIECYWESQPAGCQKPHCVFKHTKSKNSHPPESGKWEYLCITSH